MELNKPMDINLLDWDDSALIAAYNRSDSIEKNMTKLRLGNKENMKREKKSKPWKIGDYCRAIYYEDGLSYEATIISIEGDTCYVEFLGYGGYEEVSLDSLSSSLGKKARQKQRKSVKREQQIICTSDTDYSCLNEMKDVNKSIKFGQQPNLSASAEQFHAAGYAQQHPQTNLQQHSAPLPFVPPINTPIQRMGGNAHCLPPPPPPPMPPCSSAANDPALSAMLISWYMAGYYTGLHQNQKSSHCSGHPKPHCCERYVTNRCGHMC